MYFQPICNWVYIPKQIIYKWGCLIVRWECWQRLTCIDKGEMMDKIIEHENLKEEIEKKRRQLYKLLELELNGDIIVNFSQELDLLINRYNEINRQGRQGDRSSD